MTRELITSGVLLVIRKYEACLSIEIKAIILNSILNLLLNVLTACVLFFLILCR